MNKRSIAAALFVLLTPLAVSAQDVEPAGTETVVTASARDAAEFDTSYRPSPTVSLRLQRSFLDNIRWSAGVEARDRLSAAFAERAPVDIWLELVSADGLKANNVADALTAYWVLNWVAANGAYTAKIDSAPVQRQLRAAFANDPNFLKMGDQQRQELAEGYILDFLVEHAALNAAVEQRDIDTLNRLAASAVLRFRQKMKVDLLSVVPGPDGFGGRPAVAD
ncbi:hypothetical protein NIM87_11910 [Devosia sp. XJ19-1]|uniref:Uncharacterized protein n=1 Tax=Devosia ureilytica TaxID=2952754 RepID=A0A9Q4AQ78_9HYPH|nr:DUF6683 family protein [Devosia ureilytica]MCP8884212.1 hypothetical protein [Devosia ureilytica]MCP8887820.1 hypothetical protein [Devosia ureilytica]